MEEKLFYRLKKKINLFGIFISILIIVGSFGLLNKKNLLDFNSIYAIVLFLIGLFFLIINLNSFWGDKSGLYINYSSVTIRSASVTYIIQWQDIKSIYSVDDRVFLIVAIKLFDNEAVLKNKNFYVRYLASKAIKKYGTPIVIAVNLYDVSRQELLAELNYRLEKYRSLPRQNTSEI